MSPHAIASAALVLFVIACTIGLNTWSRSHPLSPEEEEDLRDPGDW